MPWQLSYAASADLDNSELQTDVMRFMAILAFCLVAIFAIVQSIPLQPVPVAAPPAEPVESIVPVNVAAAHKNERAVASPLAATQIIREAPTPTKATQTKNSLPAVSSPPVRVQRQRPITVEPKKMAITPSPATPLSLPAQVAMPRPQPAAKNLPPAVPAASETKNKGLSLRFESDAVLRGLVERQQVNVFAIDGGTFFRLRVNGYKLEFSPGNKPALYHQMVFATVPQEVAYAFESQTAMQARSVTWGVTLPSATSAQLQRFAKTRYSGGLVIDEHAALQLEGDR